MTKNKDKKQVEQPVENQQENVNVQTENGKVEVENAETAQTEEVSELSNCKPKWQNSKHAWRSWKTLNCAKWQSLTTSVVVPTKRNWNS